MALLERVRSSATSLSDADRNPASPHPASYAEASRLKGFLWSMQEAGLRVQPPLLTCHNESVIVAEAQALRGAFTRSYFTTHRSLLTGALTAPQHRLHLPLTVGGQCRSLRLKEM